MSNKFHFKIFFNFISLLMLSNALITSNLSAANVSNILPISFGTIIADPFGDIIEIDASAGFSTPHMLTAGNTIGTNGNSGRITVFSDIPGQIISLVYPVTVTLTNGGDTITIDGIQARSDFLAVSAVMGEIDFHMGGLLHIDPGQAENNYSGTITVTVNITNP